MTDWYTSVLVTSPAFHTVGMQSTVEGAMGDTRMNELVSSGFFAKKGSAGEDHRPTDSRQ